MHVCFKFERKCMSLKQTRWWGTRDIFFENDQSIAVVCAVSNTFHRGTHGLKVTHSEGALHKSTASDGKIRAHDAQNSISKSKS